MARKNGTDNVNFDTKIDLLSCLEAEILAENWSYMVAILKSKMAATKFKKIKINNSAQKNGQKG